MKLAVVLVLGMCSAQTQLIAKDTPSCTQGVVVSWTAGEKEGLGGMHVTIPNTVVLELDDRVVYLYKDTYFQSEEERELLLHVNSSLSFCDDGKKATFTDLLGHHHEMKIRIVVSKKH